MKKNKPHNHLNFDLTNLSLIGHNQIKNRTVKYFTWPNGKSPAKEWLLDLRKLKVMTLKKPKPTGSVTRRQQMTKHLDFHEDLYERLRDPEFAANYLMACIIDNDLAFLPIALGDIAKAHGISKLSDNTGINRRTLYKIFDKKGNPSFEIIS